MIYCEKCEQDKTDFGAQKLRNQVVCWDCYESYISGCENEGEADRDREDLTPTKSSE